MTNEQCAASLIRYLGLCEIAPDWATLHDVWQTARKMNGTWDKPFWPTHPAITRDEWQKARAK